MQTSEALRGESVRKAVHNTFLAKLPAPEAYMCVFLFSTVEKHGFRFCGIQKRA